MYSGRSKTSKATTNRKEQAKKLQVLVVAVKAYENKISYLQNKIKEMNKSFEKELKLNKKMSVRYCINIYK